MKQKDDTLRSQTLMLTMKALDIISKALDILSAGKPPDTVLYCVRRFCRRPPLPPGAQHGRHGWYAKSVEQPDRKTTV